MRRLAILLAAATLVLAACGSGDDNSSDTTAGGGDTTTSAGDTGTTSGTGSTVDTEGLPSYDSVAEIGADLQCDLTYDGLEDDQGEFSTCVVSDEQALIYVYNDPTFAADVAATGTPGLVYGANWTIQVDTPAVAQTIADATGGALAAG